jgi:hypothetical protein
MKRISRELFEDTVYGVPHQTEANETSRPQIQSAQNTDRYGKLAKESNFRRMSTSNLDAVQSSKYSLRRSQSIDAREYSLNDKAGSFIDQWMQDLPQAVPRQQRNSSDHSAQRGNHTTSRLDRTSRRDVNGPRTAYTALNQHDHPPVSREVGTRPDPGRSAEISRGGRHTHPQVRPPPAPR